MELERLKTSAPLGSVENVCDGDDTVLTEEEVMEEVPRGSGKVENDVSDLLPVSVVGDASGSPNQSFLRKGEVLGLP